MRGNLRWVLVLLVVAAAAAFLRPRPQPPLQASATPVQTPTPKAQPELSYFERNARKECFTFEVHGGPGDWKFRANWVIRLKAIEDERGIPDQEVERIRVALGEASEDLKRGQPLLESLHYEPHPVEVVRFSGGSCTPEANPKVWKLLHARLADTLLAREQVMLRREMHARFHL